MKRKPLIMKTISLSLLLLLCSIVVTVISVGCDNNGIGGDISDTSAQGSTDDAETSTGAPIYPVVDPDSIVFTEGTVDYRLPNSYTVDAGIWSLTIAASDKAAVIYGGHFGELSIKTSELLVIELENVKGATNQVNSSRGWKSVDVSYSGNEIKILFQNPSKATDIEIELIGRADTKGISWYTNVTNRSDEYSIAEVSYPTPTMIGETLHVFTPDRSGRAIMNAGEVGYELTDTYPGFHLSMQYYAYWGDYTGIYLGVHDPDGSSKRFSISVDDGMASLGIRLPAVGAGTAANSFTPGGYMRWEAFEGDWYDATMIYRDFVHRDANWLPEDGRPDTARKFKEIGMWANYYGSDHENSMTGMLNLRKVVGVPIATHAYNWHQIKFDTDYPHFMPARDTAIEAFQAFQDAGIYVVPYINGVSWETLDGESGYEVNYENTGVKGVAVKPNGSLAEVQYSNLKPSGAAVKLAIMCPGFTTWHDIMTNLVREMEASLPIDGVYFDQVAAVSPIACRSTEHGHTPGGGSWWSEYYNQMIHNIKADRPDESFYFTECNGETYINSFDGVLTWEWNVNDLVPAYPAIYAGYVQMVGRNTDASGADNNYFNYHFAQAVMFGQQPGWFYASSGTSATRLTFIKQCVEVRMEYIDLFNNGTLMRPPVIETNVKDLNTAKGALTPVIAQVWQSADQSQTVLFVANTGTRIADTKLHLYADEYGVECEDIMELKLPPKSIRAIVLNNN